MPWRSLYLAIYPVPAMLVFAVVATVPGAPEGTSHSGIGLAFEVGGRPREACLLVGSAADRSAAEVLRKYVARITGKEVPITATAPEGTLRIHVGATPFAQDHGLPPKGLHPFGYVIRLVDEENLVLAAVKPAGLTYAAFDLLHRFAGYRWFAPGEFGEVIPRRACIPLPAPLNIREEPSFFSYVNAGQYEANSAYLRSGWRQTLAAGHNLYQILPPDKYGKDPERFCMVEGKRFVPPVGLSGTWQPCVSHPELPRITVDWAKDYFAKNPDMAAFSACVNDGLGDCQCPQCVALKEKHGNQYIPYYNAVGELLEKELPGKWVSIYAYGGANTPPRHLRVHPNVFVMITAPFIKGGEKVKAWARAGTRHLGIYDYLYGPRFVVPRHYPHLLGNKWKETYRKYGIAGAWMETFIQCWLYDGPRQYVLDRLAWNIHEDIDALLDDYFRHFYMEAAAPMRRFFDRIEQIHSRKKDPFAFLGDGNSPAQLDEYTRADLAFLDRSLEEARARARDPMARQRVALFMKMWGYSRLEVLARLATRELEAIRPSAAHAQQVFQLAREACRALEEKANYRLSKEEEANLLISRTSFAQYKQTVQQEPYVERAVDEAFSRLRIAIAREQGEEAARQLFARQQAEHGRYGDLIRTQLYLDQHPTLIDVIRNGGFEVARATPAEGEEAALLQRNDWREFQPADWSTWHFQQTVTRFFWDTQRVHSGRRSVAIGRNQYSGCFQQMVPVTPGERYRVSVWVQQNPAKGGATLTVRWWQDGKGWRDQGENKVPTALDRLPSEAKGWQRLWCTFTVPEGVSHAVVLLSAPSQAEGEMTWFDDVRFERILDAQSSKATNGG